MFMCKLKYIRFLLLMCIIGMSTVSVSAQCEINNVPFQAGEVLTYDLHFKWGLISKKSGKATLRTQNVNYSGKPAYKISLSSSSEGTARKLFKLDDTLTSYISHNVVPLAFMKDAHEDGDHTVERLTYSYPGDGSVKVKSVRHKNGKFRFDENIQFNKCAYDMLSVVFYARTLNYDNMSKGSSQRIEFVSGRKKLSMQIIHEGYETLKVGQGDKFKCIVLSLKIKDPAFQDDKEAMKVYITSDANKMPVRIDSSLKIGSTRVVLNSYRGNKYPVTTSK